METRPVSVIRAVRALPLASFHRAHGSDRFAPSSPFTVRVKVSASAGMLRVTDFLYTVPIAICLSPGIQCRSILRVYRPRRAVLTGHRAQIDKSKRVVYPSRLQAPGVKCRNLQSLDGASALLSASLP